MHLLRSIPIPCAKLPPDSAQQLCILGFCIFADYLGDELGDGWGDEGRCLKMLRRGAWVGRRLGDRVALGDELGSGCEGRGHDTTGRWGMGLATAQGMMGKSWGTTREMRGWFGRWVGGWLGNGGRSQETTRRMVTWVGGRLGGWGEKLLFTARCTHPRQNTDKKFTKSCTHSITMVCAAVLLWLLTLACWLLAVTRTTFDLDLRRYFANNVLNALRVHSLSLSLSLYVHETHVYIYIYTCMRVHIYIYIYDVHI